MAPSPRVLRMRKPIRHLSKRRLNQILANNKQEFKYFIDPNVHKNTSEYDMHINIVDEQSHNDFLEQHICNNIGLPLDNDSLPRQISPHIIQEINDAHTNEESYRNFKGQHANHSTATAFDNFLERTTIDGLITQDNKQSSLKEELHSWVKSENISLKATNLLLKILRNHGHESELPSDARTLLGTPRNAAKAIEKINGGSYMHFGIENGLIRSMTKYFKQCPGTVYLQLNCDGMSLTKSSGSQLWPILLLIDMNISTEPFIVGVHHGDSKPNDPNVYLQRFVTEMKEIMSNGITYLNKKCKVRISKIICDTPARTFITCVKGHSGYFSCAKCIQEGEYENHVILPEIHSRLRTDKSFSDRQHPEHNTGDSILEELKIGMVSQVGLDYMHLVCLGVTKRFINIWLKGPKNLRLKNDQQACLDEIIQKVKNSIPTEFSRLPRSLSEYARWKATEFRQFLLYVGPVVLQPFLDHNYYVNFLNLSLGIRILCDSELCLEINNDAKTLLVDCVKDFIDLYGIDQLTYNIHNLIHLPDEVKSFNGSLNKFSCFPFENYLRNLRNKIQNSPKPLEQLVNRITEENKYAETIQIAKVYPIVHCLKSSEIDKIEFENFLITSKHPNNCCLTVNNGIVIIREIYYSENTVMINCNKIIQTESLFLEPHNSKKFDIHLFKKSSISGRVSIPITQICKKYVRLPYFVHDNYVLIPLIHQ